MKPNCKLHLTEIQMLIVLNDAGLPGLRSYVPPDLIKRFREAKQEFYAVQDLLNEINEATISEHNRKKNL